MNNYKLLNDWNNYEEQTKKVLKDFKFIVPILNIEHGYNKKLTKYTTLETLEDVFGFPYTSSSGFGAIWNTNTQTTLKNNNNIYFRGLAISTDGDTIAIFNNKDEDIIMYNISKEIYFDWLIFGDNNIKTLFEELKNTDFDIYISEWTSIDNITYADFGKDGFFAYFGQSAGFNWLYETATQHNPCIEHGSGFQVVEKGIVNINDLYHAYNESVNNIHKIENLKNINIDKFSREHKKVVF